MNENNRKRAVPFAERRDEENAKASELQAYLRFEKRTAFWAAVHREGIPFIKVSEKRYLFPVGAVRSWLAARTFDGSKFIKKEAAG